MKIPKGSEGTYKLKYKPDWVTSLEKPHSAQLTLSNATTGGITFRLERYCRRAIGRGSCGYSLPGTATYDS